MPKKLLILLISLCCASLDAWSRPDEASNPSETTKRFLEKYEFTFHEFTGNIPSWESHLKEFKGKPDIHYLEIGVLEGLSALWMIENILTHPTARMTAVDLFPLDLKKRFLANLETSGQAEKVTLVTGMSQLMLRDLPLNSFDIIYIDGSHTADDCLTDAVLSWPLLKQGGMMIFDDYKMGMARPAELRPILAVDSFITFFRRFLEIVERNDDQVMLRKTREIQTGEGDYFWLRNVLPIGQYIFDSGMKKLYHAETREEVELSGEEATLLNELFKAREFGETAFPLDREAFQTEEFTRLQKRLQLNLGD